ncbi:NAD(P)H-dependent oxidoreductase [uncultured Paracoccus sp.]|uniref:NADPH-dependent FMN reductase n=1 Tax=uncultured Paracoccus sp. TaxID=189685 RepID=UPI002635DD51|nr:NAD(P)H-dependent oxidoreductase [uncultured Paracoccus sp.]
MTHSVAVLVGSLRKGSINRTVAHALARVAEGKLRFDFVEIGDLPLYNDDLWQNGRGPAPVERMRAQVLGADAVLLVTPEYNRAVPGLLGNALDWGSRPSGKSCWVGKPAACAGASGGAIGTAAAQIHLKAHMVTLGMIPMGRPEFYLAFKPDAFGDDGSVRDDSLRGFLQGFVDALAGHVGRLAPVSA